MPSSSAAANPHSIHDRFMAQTHTRKTLPIPPKRRESLDYNAFHSAAAQSTPSPSNATINFTTRPAYGLPPTANTLNQTQRARLMRSTRKLGAVLGETPFLLEDPPAAAAKAKKARRHGSIYDHPGVQSVASLGMSHGGANNASMSSIDTIDSVDSLSSGSSVPIAQRRQVLGPRPLLLRLQHPRAAQPLSPRSPVMSVESRRSSSGPQATTPRPDDKMKTPSTADIYSWKNGGTAVQRKRSTPSMIRRKSSTLTVRKSSNTHLRANNAYDSEDEDVVTPLSPAFTITPAQADPKDQRRRKMAKLMRTLGEVVPAELVFPEARSSSESSSSNSSFSSGWNTDYSMHRSNGGSESDDEGLSTASPGATSPDGLAPSRAYLRAGQREPLQPKTHVRRPTHSFTDKQRAMFNSMAPVEDAAPRVTRRPSAHGLRGTGLPSSPRARPSTRAPATTAALVPTFIREETGAPEGPRTSYMRGASFSGPSQPVKEQRRSPPSSEWATTDNEEGSDVPDLKIMASSRTTFSFEPYNPNAAASVEQSHDRRVIGAPAHEWEGQWNMEDMKDVQKALRALRR